MAHHPKREESSYKEAAVVEMGVTQVKLAAWCRCSPRFIGELERGVADGNIKQVIEACRELGIDLYARPRG